MTRADTIARHLSVFETHLRGVACGFSAEERLSSASDAAAALREAFAALDGGAAVAGEANGPPEPAPPDEEPSAEVLAADDSQDEPADSCARCGQERAHLLHAPIPPGALCHGVGPLRDVYAHPFVAATPTPEPPKPVGWVVRWGIPGSYLFSQGIGVELGVSDPTDAHVYTSKADAEADARTVKHEVCVLPVDAAGNVIEAEDIGATLRREECERKAARQSGVAWEAARAGEEAERLRGELAAVKAERDAANADRDKWAANAGTLNASLRQVHTECDQLRAELDATLAECDQLRAELDATLAERDALAAEVQRAREQKPWRWIVFGANGRYLGTTSTPTLNHEDEAKDWRLAPLYLAPVVRDHSGVIAQCEEALREWDREGPGNPATSSLVAVTLIKARNALQGAS